MLTVTVSRDFWDWLALWATVAAALLALAALAVAALAIHRGNVIAANADQALARERRATFELDILARIVEECGHNSPGALEIVRGLLRVLPRDDLSEMRKAIARGTVPNREMLDRYLGEYEEAVGRRINIGSIRPTGRSRRLFNRGG